MTHSRTLSDRALAWLMTLVMLVSMMPGIPLVAQAADGGTEGMITIEMTDSYGDGWNDNAIEIYVNGELLDTATIDNGSSNTWTKEFNPHATYIFKWVKGSYASETSFVIYVGTEKKLSASGSSYNDGDELLTVPATCTEPVYENGVCTSCGAACLHQMNNGVCSACGYQCPGHSFSDGACVNCGEPCRHSATVEGVCSLCSQEINLTLELIEKYSDGWTGNAIKVYADGELLGTLTVEAGLENKTWSTPFDSYTEFTFEWVKGNYSDECSFDIYVGSEEKYAANNDTCSNLTAGVFFTISSLCAHESHGEDFKCTTCGKLCRHKDWADSVCGVCGYTCGTDAEHDWDLGTCKVCSATCNHSFTDYVCDICGLTCGTDAKHSFGEDLECDVCGFTCGTDSNHVWSKGVCTVCASVCPHESYEAGLCTNCGYYEPAVQNGVGANGFALYEIYNANQLLWFADYVNSGEILKTHTFFYDYVWTDVHYTTGCVNGKLMADIDMTGLPWNPIGVEDIGYKGYTGVFDGNAHTVSGINYTVTTEGKAHASFFGLFHGTVKNLTVRGSFKAVTTGEYTAAYAGGIAASAMDAKYACSDGDNFWYEYVYPTIENCTFIGTVSAEANNQAHAGGIAGYFYKGTMTNCLSAATVTVNECRHPSAGALVGSNHESAYTNCYYDSTLCALNACVDGALEGVTGVSTKVMASGAVAYALGFGQTLGIDAYPTYGDDAVYTATSGCVTYTNTECEIVEKTHVGTATCTAAAVCEDCSESFGEPLGHGKFGTDGKCTVCGEYDVPKQNGVGANGFALYEIENASQLLWFADYVNSGEILKTHDVYDDMGVSYTYYTTGCVNAKLIADIDMTGLPWNPIGVRDLQDRGYTGVFDGNGHTVSGIDYAMTTEDEAYASFFGFFHGTVKNLTVQGSFKAVTTGAGKIAYAGGIVAEAICVSYMVGFSMMGCTYDYVYPVIENCAFIGTVSAEANYLTYAGGIAGYVSQGTMNNCLSAATVTSNECSYPYAGALVGSDNGSTYTNCYYDSALCALDACKNGALEGVNGVSTKVMASGAVAYKLGFGQTLGTDAYPTYGDDPVYPVTTGCVTYSNTQEEVTEKTHIGTATCTAAAVCEDCGESFGEALGHSELIAATCKDKAVCGVCGESYGELADHQEFDTNAKCTFCGEYDVPKQNGVGANGFALYEIENASQLLWFANYVKSGETLKTHTYYGPDGSRFTYYTTNCVNAKLMADIDMTGLPWIPIGVGVVKDGVFISNGFSGIFDGNGHTVSGIDCTVTSDAFVYAGFFGHLSGTVKNLNVQGSFKAVTTATSKSAYAGGIAAYCAYSSFAVSYGNYDYVYPVIENCSFIGTVSAESSSSILAGGIAGYFMTGTMTNCLVAATVSFNEDVYVSAGALVGGDDRSTYTNCYYDSALCALDTCGNAEITSVTGLATEAFADGSVAYALGFGQTLGTDAYPTYGDDQVFQIMNCKENILYSNTNVNIDHTWVLIDCEIARTCSTCGISESEPLGHDWMDATCAAPKTCSVCGATEGYPDYDNHSGETTVEFNWSDPYEGECYVEANLRCGLCNQSLASSYGYGKLTGSVEAADCLNPGSETYEVTLELDGVEYTDVHTVVILSENHLGEYVDGFCSACGNFEAAVWNEGKGVYEISNAGQLYWYAQYLNTTNAEIYAELTADIVIPENAPNWKPINASYAYFNGNYHTISGLKCIGGDRTYVGLFGCEGWWYEISNLHITNSYFEGEEYVGAVVACMSNGGSVTNCAVTHTTVKGDYYAVGGLIGNLSSSHAINCFSTATVDGAEGKVLIGSHSVGYGAIENCYFLGTEDDYDGTTAMTAADFASGKVAYLLQSGIQGEDIWDDETGDWIGSAEPELIWGQTISEDAYPVLKGAKVYEVTNCKDEVAYSNSDVSGQHTDADNSGRCDACDVLMQPAKLCFASVSLKGSIAINYYMLLSDEMLADSTAYMQFTMADGEIVKIPVNEGVATDYNGETYYKFTCAVAAKEMTDIVLSQFFYEGGSTTEFSYTVKTYADYIIANSSNANEVALAKAMLNYGATAQLDFGYNNDDLANANLEAPDYSSVSIDGFTSVSGQGTELATFYSASLLLKSETTLRFFFTGSITATYNGQELEVKERNGLYYVDVVGIAAKNLDEDVTITINDGTNTADVTYNPMAYCTVVQNDTTGVANQTMKNLVAALYLYNQAANTYFEEN